jgi:anti-sigma factor RsiW
MREAAQQGSDCPGENDVDWPEVAAGLWPELRATQLIMHAALCAHCGPLLRAATSVADDPTPQEERLLAELKAPVRPDPEDFGRVTAPRSSRRQVLRWLIPAIALVVVVGVVSEMRSSSGTSLSGPKFAEFAVHTHRQHAEGSLPLEVRSDSQQAINEWFNGKSEFPVNLPVSAAVPGEERPYRLEGARFVRVAGKTAAFVAYQVQGQRMPVRAASLMVTRDSVAAASGGVEVSFNKVSFHYATVEGYKVVTWSQHGLTYALVSEEGNSSQRSCMVCHSAMRDRDLSQTPTPLPAERNFVNPVWQ